MTLQLLYFASIAERLGRSAEAFVPLASLPQLTVGDLAQQLADHHPELAPLLPALRFARNQTFVDLDEPLTDGDTVALIPPVSGG